MARALRIERAGAITAPREATSLSLAAGVVIVGETQRFGWGDGTGG